MKENQLITKSKEKGENMLLEADKAVQENNCLWLRENLEEVMKQRDSFLLVLCMNLGDVELKSPADDQIKAIRDVALAAIDFAKAAIIERKSK